MYSYDTSLRVISNNIEIEIIIETGSDGAVARLSANGLVGTGFTSWYWLQPKATFKRHNG